MAYQGSAKISDSDQQIGAFSGYVRRPLPHTAGMVAQFFGDNGEDADTITALSLTKFQDVQVFVQVYLIKDADGLLMKQADGKYPRVAKFIGVVRRPSPSRNGMIAQFFAPNGRDADSVNDLGKSSLQDCLVFIDVRGKLAAEKDKETPNISIELANEQVQKVTETQKKEYAKREKSWQKLNNELKLSSFLRNSNVLYALGTESEYNAWLMANYRCVFPEDTQLCNQLATQTVAVKGLLPHFNHLPFCNEHAEKVNTANDSQTKYLEMKQYMFVQEWALKQLQQRFSLTGNEEPEPKKIVAWASEKKLQGFLPEKYIRLAI